MDVTEDAVLRYLEEKATRPLRAVDLARALEVPRDDYREFRALLRRMERTGLVYRQRRGRYARPRDLNLVVGRLQVTRSGDGFVVGRADVDLFVPGRYRGTAVDGDTVVARVERRPRARNPEGRVIRVLERAWERVVGTFHRRARFSYVDPQEPPLDVEVLVPPGSEERAEEGEVVVVEVAEWEPAPVGRVELRLGQPGDPGVDVLAIQHGRGLPGEFPESVGREAKRVAGRGLRPEDLQGREDLRDELAFTIDPPDAKDHDDALSLVRLGADRWRVGVHIADVAFYVREESALDAEARERGTSVYLVDRVIPMLPHALSGDLCSLVPERDRLALSALFTVDGSGKVLEERIVRSVIRSRRRLSYDEAQAVLDGRERAESGLADALTGLRRVARALRRRREERGSLDFDLPEARVVLNTAGEPTDIQRILRLEAHLLIEDLMILTNEAVARLALREELPLLYRVHEEPAEKKMESLRGLAATFGYHLPRRAVEPADLARLLRALRGTPQENLLSMVTLRSMKQARYSPHNLGHFGLASAAYAHFTSPIRRYPDLVAHRSVIGWLEGRPPAAAEEEMEALGVHCSERERRATEAERDSVDLKKVQFMERHLGETFPGTVSSVLAFGFFVLLDDFHVEGLVHVSTLDDDYYEFQEEQHRLIGRRRRRQIRLGDPVRVRVARVDREERRVDLELVEMRGELAEGREPKDEARGREREPGGGGKRRRGRGGRRRS